MILMTGKELASGIREALKEQVAKMAKRPKLAVILVGHNPASEKYVSMKEKACAEVGIDFDLVRFDDSNDTAKVIEKIEELNQNNTVSGIIVQLPLPNGFDRDNIIASISPTKDVDGLTPENIKALKNGEPGIIPATPLGIINLFRYYQIELEGKNAVVLGRSHLVGSPIAKLLENEGANVAICHSGTPDISKYTREADIIISATGVKNILTGDMVKDDVAVVDVGAEVDFDTVSKKASYITPAIGGVGPMTVAMLLSNVVEASQL